MNLFDYKDLLRYKKEKDILYIHSPARKKWLRCTQEEMVRQSFIYYLIHIKQYPLSLIAEEKVCKVLARPTRFDLVIFYPNGDAFMLVEVKEPKTPLTMDNLLQVLQYQTSLEASYVCILNGNEHYLFPTHNANLQSGDNSIVTACLNQEIPSYPF